MYRLKGFFYEKNNDKSTILEIVSAENVVKADTLKLYQLMKNSEVVGATARTLNAVRTCGDVVKYAIAYGEDMKSIEHKSYCIQKLAKTVGAYVVCNVKHYRTH